MSTGTVCTRLSRLICSIVIVILTAVGHFSYAETFRGNLLTDSGLNATNSPWQVRYARWIAGYEGCWEVSIRKNEGNPAPAFVIDGDLWSPYGNNKWGVGYVFIGQKIRLPESLPVTVEFTASVQAFSLKKGGRGMFRLVVLPVAYWDSLSSALVNQPGYDKSKEIYGGTDLIGNGPDLLVWTEIKDKSPQLRKKLNAYAGREVVIAIQWGGGNASHEEWGKVDNICLNVGEPGKSAALPGRGK